jgi:hypothetical protein
LAVGWLVGFTDGCEEGWFEGSLDGLEVGTLLGKFVETTVG